MVVVLVYCGDMVLWLYYSGCGVDVVVVEWQWGSSRVRWVGGVFVWCS